jgi:Trk-type K+ transport system membrane component
MGWFSSLKEYLKPNYYRLHWLYITSVTILGALPIFFLEKNVSFDDALYMTASSISGTGLSTVDITKWGWISQAVLPVLMVLGSPILMTLVPVFFRRLFFRRKFTKAQREHSPEYKALRAIYRIVIGYFLITHVLSILILTLWSQFTPYALELLESRGQLSYQWATFLTFSAFANSGLTTLQDNMVAWSRSPVPLLVAAYLTLAGNTAFPILIRVIVYLCYVTANKKEKPVYEHLLQHPRRYFTHLFLKKQTWWLFVSLVVINLLQFVAFLLLDWNSPAVEGMSPGLKLLNCFFSSIVTRTSGFNSLDITLLNPAMLVLYAAIMYISSTPVVVTVRTTDEGAVEVEEEIEDELEHVKEVAEEVQIFFNNKKNKKKKKKKKKKKRREKCVGMLWHAYSSGFFFFFFVSVDPGN